MRVVVSLGHAALETGGEVAAHADRFRGVQLAVRELHALLDEGHELVVAHAHERPAPDPRASPDRPDARALSLQSARADGITGYLLEQALRSASDAKRSFVTVVTHTLVDERDAAFAAPARGVGPLVDELEARRLERERRWTMRPSGERWQRAVAAPEPVTVLQSGAIATLLTAGHTVVCSGGGIAVARDVRRRERGVEAQVDPDLGAALIAREVGADALLLATDVAGVYEDWPSRGRLARLLESGSLELERFDVGSMRPKVDAALRFARRGGHAAIGALAELPALLEGRAGTRIVR